MTASALLEIRRRARQSGVRTPAALSRQLPTPPAEIAPTQLLPRLTLQKLPYTRRRFAWSGVLGNEYAAAQLTA